MIRRYKRILLEQSIRNYLEVFDDDIFLVSYPRSGNTWMRFLLGSLLYEERIDWNNFEEYIPDIYRNTDKELKKLQRPRVLKSHHPYDKRYNKVIYLVRDVRDVLVSYYKFHLKFGKIKDGYSLDEFIIDFVSGNLDDFGTWGENVEGWIGNRNKVKYGFLLIRYEDLLDDTYGEIIKVLEFLNCKVEKDKINDAIEWSSFSNMRKLENNQKDSQLFKNADRDIKFVNKGKFGTWKNVLNSTQRNIIHNEYSDILVKLGYKI